MMKHFVSPALIAACLAASAAIATSAIAQSEATEETVERLFATVATAADPALPELSFETWFGELLPEGAGKIFELTDCSLEFEGDQPPSCLTIDAVIVSRDRNLHLEFERDSLAFRGGAMSSEELEGAFTVESLAELPALLRQAIRPIPLRCPANTVLRQRESYAGLFEWCEDAGGTRQGAARSWFSTGLYLLDKGQYTDGAKTGEWTECDRFETCRFNTYVDGVLQ